MIIEQSLFKKLMKPFTPFEQNPTLAVAVSGGPDSLSLAYALQDWVGNHGGKVIGLIVDHQLRPESTAEAHLTQKWLQDYGIDAYILSWEGEKPTTRIQEQARDARYHLLTHWCQQHHILHLCVGHHLDDQIETLRQRHLKKSGIHGLQGIPACSWRSFGRIIRPWLTRPKQDLLDTLHAKNHSYLCDSSNSNIRFERAQLRLSPLTAQEQNKLLQEKHTVQRQYQGQNRILAEFYTQALHISPYGFFRLTRTAFENLTLALKVAAVRALCQTLQPGHYPPSPRAIQKILEKLPKNRVATLHHCQLRYSRDYLTVSREERHLPPARYLTQPTSFWDHRFQVHLTPDNFIPHQTWIEPIGRSRAERHAETYGVPAYILSTLPCIRYADTRANRLLLPHVSQEPPYIHFMPKTPILSA